jgi:HK97 family phage major capsid protein
MDVLKLQKAHQAKLAEAIALGDQYKDSPEGIPADVRDQNTGLLGQSDEIKASLALAQQLADAETAAGEPMGTKAAHLGWRETGPDEGLPEVDTQSWREVKVGERTVRVFIPEAVTQKGYNAAFEAYVRGGKHSLGPQDRKTLSAGSDAAGGFLIPEDFQMEIIKKSAAMSTIRANARVAQTSRDAAKWPRVVYNDDDKYTSGVRLTWTGETPASSTTHRVTDPVFGLITIPVHTAMASLPLTNDLLEDSAFDVFGLGSELMAEAFALGENDAFINGNGVSRPMGILTQVNDANYAGPRQVVSGAAATLTGDGLINLAYALPPQYESNAKWFMNKATEGVVRKLIGTTSGNYLWPVINSVGGLGPAQPQLLGFPIVRDQFFPDVTTDAYPIVFGDMTGYLVLDRVGLSLQRLDELYAETNITVLLARRRVGGQLIAPFRLKAQKVST